MSAYELRGVAFGYGGHPVLSGIDLDVPQGGVAALVGPNGSGKTTLLHLLAFLAPPAEGSLRFLGREVGPQHLAECRRRVGVVLQNPYLFRGSVRANVEWALRARGVVGRERGSRVGTALDRVGLGGVAGRSAQALSGGEAQRVALARVLALEPEVILLDEPTNHVDETTRADVEILLSGWVRERGTTLVLATHDLAQARRLRAEVWRLDEGRARRGEADNVFRGRPEPGEAGVFRAGKLRIFAQPLPAAASCVEVSPREVILSREAFPSSARNALAGVVVSAQMLPGEEVRVVLDCGEPVAAVVTRASWERLGATVGQPAVASFKATSVRAY